MRNLPESVTIEALAEVFGKFGALRGAQPVSIKRSKEKEKDTFAFVDFQEPAAQQAAIAGPVTLDGQQVLFIILFVKSYTKSWAFKAACRPQKGLPFQMCSAGRLARC